MGEDTFDKLIRQGRLHALIFLIVAVVSIAGAAILYISVSITAPIGALVGGLCGFGFGCMILAVVVGKAQKTLYIQRDIVFRNKALAEKIASGQI